MPPEETCLIFRQSPNRRRRLLGLELSHQLLVRPPLRIPARKNHWNRLHLPEEPPPRNHRHRGNQKDRLRRQVEAAGAENGLLFCRLVQDLRRMLSSSCVSVREGP